MTSTIQKQLAAHEDLLLGSGTTSQIRGESSEVVRRIELSFILRTNQEIRDLDVTRYTRVQLHQQGATKEFWYDATSSLVDDDDDILEPTSSPATGRWLNTTLGVSGGSFLPLAGGDMSGPIDMLTDDDDVQVSLFGASASGEDAGLQIRDYVGSNVLAEYINDGNNIILNRIYNSGNNEFHDAQQASGFNRFIGLSDNGQNAKMVLGSPWEDGVGLPSGKGGYDHWQLVFKRDAETTTPFHESITNGIRQYWLSGKGEALFTGGIELAQYNGSGTFSYTMYAESGGGTDGQIKLKPNRSLVSGSPSWFRGEFVIETSSTTDPISNPNDYHEFRFHDDGQFETEGLTMTGDGKLGLFGVTPVIQFNSFGETAGFVAGAGTSVLDDSTFTGNIGSTAVTISDLVAAAKTYGLLPE